jgi:hypothetical protein
VIVFEFLFDEHLSLKNDCCVWDFWIWAGSADEGASKEIFQVKVIFKNMPDIQVLQENTDLNEFVVVYRIAMFDNTSSEFCSWNADIVVR